MAHDPVMHTRRPLAKFYGLDPEDAHPALPDAFLTPRIWQKMLHTLKAKGIGNLGKLLGIGGARR